MSPYASLVLATIPRRTNRVRRAPLSVRPKTSLRACASCALTFQDEQSLAAHMYRNGDAPGGGRQIGDCKPVSTLFCSNWTRTPEGGFSKPVARESRPVDPAVNTDTWRFRCLKCHKYFADGTGFDAHHAIISTVGRCLDTDELKALEFKLAYGVWNTVQGVSRTSEFRVAGLPSVRAERRISVGADTPNLSLGVP